MAWRNATWVVLWALGSAGCSDDGTAAGSGTQSAGSTQGETAAEGTDSGSGPDSMGTADSNAQTSTTSASSDSADPSATTAGSTGASGTGGPVLGGSCEVDADCEVFDDCCSCDAVPIGEGPEPCPLDCLVSKCTELGVEMPTPICRFGTCELQPIDCNAALVTCDERPPTCDDDLVPSVGDDGCWTQQCVPAALCNVVPACSYCTDTETCVTRNTQLGPESVCEPIDPGCNSTITCGCMDPCQDPFVCSDGGDPGNELACDCPVCG